MGIVFPCGKGFQVMIYLIALRKTQLFHEPLPSGIFNLVDGTIALNPDGLTIHPVLKNGRCNKSPFVIQVYKSNYEKPSPHTCQPIEPIKPDQKHIVD